jgi:hypothetical protein
MDSHAEYFEEFENGAATGRRNERWQSRQPTAHVTDSDALRDQLAASLYAKRPGSPVTRKTYRYWVDLVLDELQRYQEGVISTVAGQPEDPVARDARSDSWSDFKDIYQPASLSFFGLEAAASLILDYNALLVPGLLQTEEYARELLSKIFGYSADEIDRRWDARSRRQGLHERPTPPEMLYLLDEAVVRRSTAIPGVMRRQLEYLVEMNDRDRISIRVIPFGAGVHPGMTGPFILLGFPNPEDGDALYLEHVDGDKVIREDPAVTGAYAERFFYLEKIALSRDETSRLLTEIIARMAQNKRI